MITPLTLRRTDPHLATPIIGLQRKAYDMTTRFSWAPSPAADGVTLYRLEKSLDKGLTFASLDVIVNSTSEPDYDPDNNEFFYVDNDPQAGEIVRVRAENSFAVGAWGYVFCPPAAPRTCTLYGTVLDGTGQPSSNTQVILGVVRPPDVQDGQVPAISSSTNLFALKSNVTKVTDREGAVQIKMLQGSIASIDIPELRMSMTFRVPEIDLLNLVDVPQYEIPGFQAQPGRR